MSAFGSRKSEESANIKSTFIGPNIVNGCRLSSTSLSLSLDSHDLMDTITYRAYSGEHELPHIISLVQSELSEPYVVYTYRYFLHQWSVPLYFIHPT